MKAAQAEALAQAQARARFNFEICGLGALLEEVAAAHAVSAQEMLTVRRARYFAARRDLCTRLRARGMSYPAIGRLVGLDRVTVIEACTRRRWRARRYGGRLAP